MPEKQIALVSGGTRGIGAAISARLIKAEYEVIALYNQNEEQANNFKRETNVHILKCDVSHYDTCADTIENIQNEYGKISVLVNNAGITRDGFFHKMDRQMWSDVINTNLNGVFNLTHLIWPSMIENGYGRVINISSINGQTGQMGQANYSATKAAVLGFTRTLALEGARRGVTVNAVAPGYIETDMMASIPEKVLDKIIAKIPIGRLGKADEIARCVEFLADPASSFITGSTLTANGAQHLV
ncbi:acetoacetyl-CoA reductase [Litorimonas sp. WD9-15]|uniref:acetoacetyl-CoA reductase n=1 Tax=Litorimonas sp. WD9-15 TaxID=3418716 RepID=UPI003D023E30